jgi:hypothetical protein
MVIFELSAIASCLRAIERLVAVSVLFHELPRLLSCDDQ